MKIKKKTSFVQLPVHFSTGVKTASHYKCLGLRKTCKAEAKINYVKQAYAKLHLAVAYIAPFFPLVFAPSIIQRDIY